MNEQQLAAVKQALEAFSVLSMNDYSGYECSKHEADKIDEAVTALQSIISQDALDKMADNARELGLDYEPAVHEGRDWSLLAATQESLREHMAEIKRLKATQPAPVQHDECVVCGDKVRVIPRPWVGLTETEIDTWNIVGHETLREFIRAIEAKLKGKNHG
jgi:hypothetical protein